MDFTINIDTNSGVALHHQLYKEIKQAILNGRLKPAQKIPSSRALAQLLGLSRTTITNCYDELTSEGYLESTTGLGTFVCQNLPEKLLQIKQNTSNSSSQNTVNNSLDINTNLANFAHRLPNLPKIPRSILQPKFSFRAWSPDLESFPLAEWGRLLSRYCRTGKKELLGYTHDPLGHKPLRIAIANYLTRARAVSCQPSQVIIVSGSQQALDFIARIFIDPADNVAIEEPGYLGARQAFLSYGANIYPIEVDKQGLIVDRLVESRQQQFKLVYLTPSHQFPTGTVLSLTRRLELLSWAEKENTLIIEDDYDSEYRYGGRPIPALQGLRPNSNVIYVGTFSKVLFPALRIGYLVVPPSLINIFSEVKYISDRLSPMIEQHVLAEFINNGSLEKHIRRMRTLYNQRRKALVLALEKYFGDRAEIIGENAGMHLMVSLKLNLSEQEITKRANENFIELISARDYYLEPKKENEFILGYATLSEAAINESIKHLAKILLS